MPATPKLRTFLEPLSHSKPASTSSWADEDEDESFDCAVFAGWGYTEAELESRGLALAPLADVEEDEEEAYDFAADDRFVDLRALRKPLPPRVAAAIDYRDETRRLALYNCARARAASMGFVH